MAARCKPSKVPTGLEILSDGEISALSAEEIEKIVDSLNVRLNGIADDLVMVEQANGRYLSILPPGTVTPASIEVRKDRVRLVKEQSLLLGYFEKLRREYRKRTGWD